MKKLNAFHLKIIALIVMLMDHLLSAFPSVFPSWFHPFSRFVGPLFAFLMVEGLFHTRNKFKYNIRLFGWAIFMEVGNFIISTSLASKEVHVSNNIFLTLAIGLTILNLLELIKNKTGYEKLALLVAAILLIPVSFVCAEGAMSLIPFILITYFFRGNNKKLMISYVILFIALFSLSYAPYDTIKETIDMLMFNSDFLFILVIPFMLLYNGERGLNNKFSKYVFYVFYPLHLWLLAIMQFILN